jgi:hypothetical protein
MTTINLPITTPRDVAMIKNSFPLNDGLWGSYFFGYFALAGLIFFLFLLLFVFPTKNIGLKVFQLGSVLLLVGGASYYFLHKANSTYTNRLNALSNGQAVNAIVTDQGKTFNPLKSSRDYSLEVTFNDSEGIKHSTTLTSSSDALHQYKLGETIHGVYDKQNDATYFPVIYGYAINFQ